MEALSHVWGEQQLEQHLVEPNSGLAWISHIPTNQRPLANA